MASSLHPFQPASHTHWQLAPPSSTAVSLVRNRPQLSSALEVASPTTTTHHPTRQMPSRATLPRVHSLATKSTRRPAVRPQMSPCSVSSLRSLLAGTRPWQSVEPLHPLHPGAQLSPCSMTTALPHLWQEDPWLCEPTLLPERRCLQRHHPGIQRHWRELRIWLEGHQGLGYRHRPWNSKLP